MSIKEKLINKIIAVEGGYINDSEDSGGETNFGITRKVAVANGYTGEIIALPKELAFDIYVSKYWDRVMGDSLLELSEDLVYEIVDTAINAGSTVAVKFLQRVLNVFNNKQKYYPDIIVDGVIGNTTLRTIKMFEKRNDYKTLVKALNCLQGAFYIELAERREKDEKFINGWIKNRIK